MAFQNDTNKIPANASGFTVFHQAVYHNKIDELKKLVKKPKGIDQTAANGLAPSHIAAQLGHLECLKLLIEAKGA